MTATQLFSVIVRIAGIVILLWGLRSHVPYLAGLLGPSPIALWDVLSLTVIVMSVVAGIIMVAAPGAVARRFLPFPGESKLSASLSAEDLQLVLISTLGLWTLVQGLLDGAYMMVVWSMYQGAIRSAGSTWLMAPEQMGTLASAIGEIVFGLAMLFRARSLTALVTRLRTI